jgi:hypothetical protein
MIGQLERLMAMADLRQLLSLGLIAGLTLAGCSGGGSSSDDAGPDGGFVLTCQDDSRVTAYAPGVTATSLDGQMKVTFMSATPAPPAAFGLNAWTVKITDGSGNPLPNLPLIARSLPPDQTLYMPDMGHGANAPVIDGGTGGVYEYSDAYLTMPGIWQIIFAVDGGESAQVDFCVTQ